MLPSFVIFKQNCAVYGWHTETSDPDAKFAYISTLPTAGPTINLCWSGCATLIGTPDIKLTYSGRPPVK